MSKIIITTMEEIPENCFDCPCADHENGRCQADKEGRSTQVYRPFWCPLKEEYAMFPLPGEYFKATDSSESAGTVGTPINMER